MDQHRYSNVIQDLKTIRDYIRFSVSQLRSHEVFFGHGTDNAWDEAVHLVLDTVELPLDVDPRALDSRLTKVEREKVLNILEQRIFDRVPLPYLTRKAYLSGLPFLVSPEVLIPRSPIAEIIEKGFQPWISYDSVHKVLDLCTGSGCIAILMALAFDNAKVDAIDISPAALKIAKHNVDYYDLQEQVNLIESDLCAAVPDERYDIIISNPPYVPNADVEVLPKEYQHEPKLGFNGGADGIDLVIKILAQAANHLSTDGVLIVEVGLAKDNLIAALPEVPFIWLDFERGGDGVFILTARDVEAHRHSFDRLQQDRC